MPRGFEDAAESPVADALRLKSFTVSRDLSLAVLAKPDVVKKIIAFAHDAEPLLRFGWQALTVLDPTALARRR